MKTLNYLLIARIRLGLIASQGWSSEESPHTVTAWGEKWYQLGCCLVSKSCPTLLRPHRLQPTRLLCPWDFSGKNTGMGSHSLLQGIFLTQGLNIRLLHCRWILHPWATREALRDFLQASKDLFPRSLTWLLAGLSSSPCRPPYKCFGTSRNRWHKRESECKKGCWRQKSPSFL